MHDQPQIIPYARRVEIPVAPVVARPVSPYLNPWLMPAGQAWIDIGWMIAAIIGAFTLVIVSMVLGLFRPPTGFELIVQPLGAGPILLIAIWIILRRRRQNFRALGLGRMSAGSALGWGLLAIVAVQFLNILLLIALTVIAPEQLLMRIAHQREPLIAAISETPPVWILPVTVLVGLYEELVMRGLILSRLTVIFKGTGWPIVITSLLFGLMHFSQGPFGMVQTACLGFLFAALAVWRRNLWPCIIAHTLLDTGSIIIAVYLGPTLREMLRSLPAPAP